MAYSQELVQQLSDIFERSNIHAKFDGEGEVGLFEIRMKLSCRLQNVAMSVIVREDNFSSLATLPLAADENSRLAVAEYLTRVNYNMRNGNFELSMDDGTIRFKAYHHVGAGPLDARAGRLTVLLPFLMIDRYGNGLIDVLFGLKSPREAYEAIG